MNQMLGQYMTTNEFLFLIDQRLYRMERRLTFLMRSLLKEQHMAQADIDQLKAKVEKNTSVSQSAVTLIKGLADQIREAADDPAELNALADSLEQSSTALGDAVTANTPSA